MFSTHRLDSQRGARRSMVLARHGMVCTSQPLASQAAVEMLRAGGNAVDAAVCAAAALGVVEPFITGIGGDCFMLIWHAARTAAVRPQRQRARAARRDTRGDARARPRDDADARHAVRHRPRRRRRVVRGARRASAAARSARPSRRRSTTPTSGFPVSEIIATQWSFAASLLQNDDARRAFTVDGRAPRLGEIVRLPELAGSLRRSPPADATSSTAASWRGRSPTARAPTADCSTQADLAAHESTWVEPISTDYRGVEVCELPPNGQGLTALIALNILECFDLADAAIRTYAPTCRSRR